MLEDQRRMAAEADKNVGRYPRGYRQFESYENYKMFNPGATMQEYHELMNKQIEFDEYFALMKTVFLYYADTP